jgi:hypothetical protein
MPQTCKEKFIALDNMGESFGFTIDGQDKYKTSCGSCVTIICSIIVGLYAALKFNDLA